MTDVTRQAKLLATIVAVSAVAGGCTESTRPEATGKGSVRGIHAIVDAPDVNFLIEERSIGAVGYKQSTALANYDDLDYTFNFDSLPIGDQPARRLASQFIEFQADIEYTMVLTGSFSIPSILSWEAPEREWDGTETVFEIDFVHASPLLGQVDLYFIESGTAPVDGNPIATMQFGDRIPYRELPAGAYEVFVTPPNDPGTILYQSLALPAPGAVRVTLMLNDVDPTITAPVAVTLINSAGTTTSLADNRYPSQLRLLNTRFNGNNVDAYFDSDFDNVVFADVEFGELTPWADMPGLTTLLTLTDAGDAATTVHEGNVAVQVNSRATVLFGGPDDILIFKLARHDARPLSTYPVARISNLVTSILAVDIYLLEPGTPIDDQVTPAITGMLGAADTGFFRMESGMRELTVTLNGEKDAIATPVVVDVAPGDVLDFIVLDTADPAAVEMVIFDSNQP